MSPKLLPPLELAAAATNLQGTIAVWLWIASAVAVFSAVGIVWLYTWGQD